MSDAPDQRRGATAPFGSPPAPNPAPEAPANVRGTQMSAAVPPTLDSPQLAPVDEISGAAVAGQTTDRDGVAREGAHRGMAARDAAVDPSVRQAPPTMMSPVVPAPRAGESAPLSPEDAVTEAAAPAHAYVAHGGAPPAYGAPGMMLHHGGAHAHPLPHAPGHGSGVQPRSSSTSLVVIVAAALAALVLALAAVGVGAYLYTRKRPQAELDKRRAQTSSAPAPIETAAPPGSPPPSPPAIPTASPPRAQPNVRNPAAAPAAGAPGAAAGGAAAPPAAAAPPSPRRPK